MLSGEFLNGTSYPKLSFATEGNYLMVAKCFGVYPSWEFQVAQRGDAKGSLAIADITGLVADGGDLREISDVKRVLIRARIQSFLPFVRKFYVNSDSVNLSGWLGQQSLEELKMKVINNKSKSKGIGMSWGTFYTLGEEILAPYRHRLF